MARTVSPTNSDCCCRRFRVLNAVLIEPAGSRHEMPMICLEEIVFEYLRNRRYVSDGDGCHCTCPRPGAPMEALRLRRDSQRCEATRDQKRDPAKARSSASGSPSGSNADDVVETCSPRLLPLICNPFIVKARRPAGDGIRCYEVHCRATRNRDPLLRLRPIIVICRSTKRICDNRAHNENIAVITIEACWRAGTVCGKMSFGLLWFFDEL
ncbi:hypothetical protein Zmor_012692 [Zophobas morio]|uniref:Uncharacterized protein n=1 Tax=Zophobas morio TaxID=2755281 RepID=A0AA38ICL7_9CUCU|nr:hypothetical protein Zmor_012692 [Zophobas morio]